MTLGGLTIYLAAALGAIAFVAAVLWARGNAKAERGFTFAYYGMTALLGLACFLLMQAILIHDFRFDYVIGYSSRDLPLIYLISAFWGGQQGTFLLWAFMGALIGLPLFRKRAWEPAAVMACYLPSILFQIAMMLDSGGNPFRLAAQVPPDGRGLNPLLQDPWMAIHPPFVFLGYAAMTVPAALALAALLRREETKWLDVGLRWSLIGFLTLGGGIILGGFWAYKVLGWGGYWGWDPVENASLVPWIVVTALVHGLVVQRATGALRRINLVLALGGYVLVLYATFLTRSGVLADFSVHSFPAGSLYRVLVTIQLVVLIAAVVAFVRRDNVNGAPIPINASWQFLLSLAIGIFSFSAVMVLVGTSMPILSSWAQKPFVPSPSFYNKSNLPLYVLGLLILGVAPFSAWRKDSWRLWGRGWMVALVCAVAGTLAAVALGARGVPYLVLLLAALFAAVSNAIRLTQVARVRALHTGAALAHLGFAVMFVGILTSSAWDREAETKLPLGEPVEEIGQVFTYRGHVDGTSPKDLWRVAVLDPGGEERTGLVRMYATNDGSPEGSLMRNPAILRSPLRDVYIAPVGLETGTHSVELAEGRPAELHGARLTFTGFRMEQTPEGHSRVGAGIRIEAPDGRSEDVELYLIQRQSDLMAVPVQPQLLEGATLALARMAVEQRAVVVEARDAGPAEALVANVAIKPGINLVWAGTILMCLGCTVAIVRRWLEGREAAVTIPVAAGAAAPRSERPAPAGANRSA